MIKKPKIVISKCLGFSNCRYDGQEIDNNFVKRLKKYVNFITVCPEVGIGLKVPREALRIIKKDKKILYQPTSKKDLTKKIIAFSKNFLDSLEDIQGFILKNRSPCCGVNSAKIYDGFGEKARHYNGNGFFTDVVLKYFPLIPIEDEGRLRNFSIRENFLIKIFALNEFQQIKNIKSLKKFHSKNEFLFLIYSRKIFKNLETIIQKNKEFKDLIREYQFNLYKLFSNPPSSKSWIKGIMESFERFSSNLSDKEKKFFLENIKEYENEKIPLSALIKLISVEALRFKDKFLLNQTFLQPYPLDLMDISDSGTGREY